VASLKLKDSTAAKTGSGGGLKKPLRLRDSRPAELPTDVRILGIATDHIRRHGIERTTILSIAAEAGMSHANIYRYYPSKIALIEEISADWLKPLEMSLHVIGDAPDPAFDKLERLIFALHRAYRDKCETDPAIFSLFATASTQGAAIARRHYGRRDAEMRRILDEGLSGHGFEPIEPKRALALILDSVYRFIDPAVMKLDFDIPRPLMEQRLARVTKAIFRALSSGRI
jgi:AcrR family transcriptional regulator